MKFGGTSIEDGAAFDRVAQIVRAYQFAAPVVIASAMSRVTDALMKSQHLATSGQANKAIQTLDEHFRRHWQVADRLSKNAGLRMQRLVDAARSEIASQLELAASSSMTTKARHDSITAHGERLSANLLALVLEEYGLPATYVDAGRCLLTNEEYGNAKPLIKETYRQTRNELEPLIEARRVPVLGGFFAATSRGVTTTLGRGSSDYTATLISAALGARETQIWTDVDGVLTADPRLVKTARTVPALSYAEAAELARLGARVLHSKMILPVLDQQIPVRICNSRAPEQIGTLISALPKSTAHTIKAIAHRTNLIQVDITSTPTLVANGFLHAIEQVFERHQTEMDIVARSPVGLSCTFASGGPQVIVQELERIGRVEVQSCRAMVSCIGEGVDQAFAERTLKEIDPALSWQGTTSNSLISVVDEGQLASVVGRLHEGIFEEDRAEKKRTTHAS